MGALGLRLGQGQAREAGTEKSDVSGISLSRAARSIACALARSGMISATQKTAFALHNKTGSDVFITASAIASWVPLLKGT